MPYTSFHPYFREIAEKETRTITIVQDDHVIPKGSYGLLEMYCDEPGCDCRRVFFEVYDWERGKDMAFIAYGWESEEFYRRWLKTDDPAAAREMQGPVLNIGSPQSQYAREFLEIVKNVILSDPAYIARLKRHYQMFKEKVDPKHFRKFDSAKHVDSVKPKKKRKRH
ncbi:MAG: hypothetical protein Fur0043_18050 [Anaerolineales bacterium]